MLFGLLASVFLLIFLTAPLLPSSASAQERVPAQATGFEQICSKSIGIAGCIARIYIFSLGAGALIALLMVVLAGYRYMTAGGNAEQVTTAKESFESALKGLIIIFVGFILLYLINPDLVQFKNFNQTLDLPKLMPQAGNGNNSQIQNTNVAMDLNIRRPGSNSVEIATYRPTRPLAGTDSGTWTVTGIRPHQGQDEHSGDFTDVTAQFVVTATSAGPRISGVVLERVDNENFSEKTTGTNLGAEIFVDVRYRRPGSNADEVSLNWQTGPDETLDDALAVPGTWTVTGIRVYEDVGGPTGVFVQVQASFDISTEMKVNNITLERIDEQNYMSRITGVNLTPSTFFDVRFRRPNSKTDEFAPNWQTGPEHVQNIGGAEPGTWTITGIRAHTAESDHSGEFITVTSTYEIVIKLQPLLTFMQDLGLPSLGVKYATDDQPSRQIYINCEKQVLPDTTWVEILVSEVGCAEIIDQGGQRVIRIFLFDGYPAGSITTNRVGTMQLGLDANDNLTGINQIRLYENDPQNFFQMNQNIDLATLTGTTDIIRGQGPASENWRILYDGSDSVAVLKDGSPFATVKHVIAGDDTSFLLLYSNNKDLIGVLAVSTQSLQDDSVDRSILSFLSDSDFEAPTAEQILKWGSAAQKSRLSLFDIQQVLGEFVDGYSVPGFSFFRFPDGSVGLFGTDDKVKLIVLLPPAQPVPMYAKADPATQDVSVVLRDTSNNSLSVELFSSDFASKISPSGPQAPLPPLLQTKVDVLRQSGVTMHFLPLGDPAHPTGWINWDGNDISHLYLWDETGLATGALFLNTDGTWRAESPGGDVIDAGTDNAWSEAYNPGPGFTYAWSLNLSGGQRAVTFVNFRSAEVVTVILNYNP